jgi:hypothetical protein
MVKIYVQIVESHGEGVFKQPPRRGLEVAIRTKDRVVGGTNLSPFRLPNPETASPAVT